MDLETFDDLDLVLVCGLPGAGTARFWATCFRPSGRRRVARRDVRHMLFEMTAFGEPWSEERYNAVEEGLVKHTERKIIEHLLQQRLAVVAENTGATLASRRSYLGIARQRHRSAGLEPPDAGEGFDRLMIAAGH
jgi:hypothetical protein